jgi:cell division protein ZipA
MTELRWVLLALGILVIIGIYLWGRGLPQRWLAPLLSLRKPASDSSPAVRLEPALDDDTPSPIVDGPGDAHPREEAAPPETVVTLRFMPRDKRIACDRVVLALRAAGLKHGRYGIFHMHASDLSDEPMFSVANLTEPGSFDMSKLAETKIPGMSFFMVLPGEGDPVERFDRMVATAHELARELDGELRDEKGSSWSIQRERYVREEIIEYRHSLDKSLPD